MIFFNLKLAIRNLLKNKVYSILIISGFAIGFSACTLIGLYYHTEKTVNKGFANYQQIYRLYDIKKNRCNLNHDLLPIVQNYTEVDDACPLEYVAGIRLVAKNEQTHSNTEIGHLLSTNNNFFSVFNVTMAETLGSKPFNGKESMVVSSSVAKKLFGSQNPLGQQVNLNNFFSGTITGIFDDLPANSTFQADLILNSDNEEFRLSSSCNNGKCYYPTNLFVKLKEGTNPCGFSQKLNGTIGSYAMDVDSVGVQNLAEIYLSTLTMKSRHAKGNPNLLKIFLAIALLILILTSMNYLGYSISMQFSKMKEIGINKTNGANLKHLFHYSFTEVSLGILISTVLSILITLLALPYSERLFGKALYVTQKDIAVHLPILIGTILMVILVNSLPPIYFVSKFKIAEFLSGLGGKRNRKQIGKQAILTFQLTASIALIAVVMIIFKQLHYVKHSNLGFNKDLLVRIDIPWEYPHTESLKHETDKLPFVQSSSISYGCPGMINMRMGSNTGKSSFDIDYISVDNDFLKTMGIALLDGREFLGGDIEKACLMNEEAIKQYQWETLEGKRFENGGGYEVIGIVNDFKVNSFHHKVQPLVLVYSKKQEGNILSVKLAPGNIGQQMDQIKTIWKKFSPFEPMNFTFYDDQFQAMYAKEEKLAMSITFFSVIAIVLTCMGILGHIFMTCLNKVKEIGIRKVNGARISEVLVMLNRGFVKWVAIAFVIATPIAYYAMNKWLENFAYKTELSWWIFALAGLLALGIALLTVSWQSWRAATRNPVEALRYE